MNNLHNLCVDVAILMSDEGIEKHISYVDMDDVFAHGIPSHAARAAYLAGKALKVTIEWVDEEEAQ